MPNIDSIKAELLDKLWLPKVKEAKALIYPRRKKNARMSLFTLTDGIGSGEILKFEEENLIRREDVTAWARTMTKRWRAESESVGCVLDGHVYAEAFLGPSCPLNNRFPFEIINLDFGSQEPASEQGRIEKEIVKIERVIRLQNQKGCDKFVLIYTTFIDTCDINAEGVVRTSDALTMDGWTGLNLNNFTSPISNFVHKQEFLRILLEKLTQKYAYKCAHGIAYLSCEIPGGQKHLFSVVGIITR